MSNGSGLSICALLIGEYKSDRLLVHEIFRDAGWRLLEARDRKKALAHLDRHSVQVVIARCDVPSWDWKNLLESLRNRPRPPQLIVTSRTADEQLWSEVLNCGGYDVLPQPFQREEMERVVAAAVRNYARGPAPERPLQRASVA
jgi:DNA-binding response OmpR family regulator